jgi:peptidoglycan/LPS O-acetylase OafA/YrhL
MTTASGSGESEKRPELSRAQSAKGRILELDGIRGAAILMVIVWHYFCSEIHPSRHSLLGAVAIPFRLCWSGVDLFFVLSGFLIGGILVDSREAANYFRVFYTRRVCRLGPVYLMLLASFGLAYLLCDPHGRFSWLLENPLPAASYITFTQNVFMGIRGTFGASWLAPTWSLAVEEQFYSLLPILVWALSPKALHRTLIVAICAAPLLRAPFSDIVGQVEMPMRSDSLLLGVVVAIGVRNAWFLETIRRQKRALAVVLGVLLAGAALMCVRGSWFGVFLQTWLAALYAVLILTPFADGDALASRILRAPVLRFFGKVSYSLYLVHQIVVGLLHGLVYGREPRIDDVRGAALTGLSLAISVALAYAIFTWIEKNAVAYGHRHVYVAKSERPAVVTGSPGM